MTKRGTTMADAGHTSTNARTKLPDKGCCVFATLCIVFVTAAFGIAGLNLHLYRKTSNFYSYHMGDEVSVRGIGGDISTFLCGSYRVRPWESANVYLLPSKAEIDYRHKKFVNVALDGLLANNAYNARGFYLLKGSDIHITGCRKNEDPETNNIPVEILLFKGDDSWLNWRVADHTFKSCAIKTVIIRKDQKCNEQNATLRFTVRDDENYYVAVTRKREPDQPIAVPLSVILHVSKTTYDLQRYRKVCFNTNDCNLKLKYNSYEDIVVMFPEPEFRFGSTGSFTTDCKIRVMFWVGVFAIFPGSMIALILLACCWYTRCLNGRQSKSNSVKQKLASVYSTSNDTNNLTRNETLPPGYMTR